MKNKIICNSCKSEISRNEHVYCQDCYELLVTEIEDLQNEIEELEETITELEDQLEQSE